jgi:hypothetical protein
LIVCVIIIARAYRKIEGAEKNLLKNAKKRLEIPSDH